MNLYIWTIIYYIKRFIFYFYDYLYQKYYIKCNNNLKINVHRNLCKDPIFIVNGILNLQVSEHSFILNMDFLNKTHILNILPLCNDKIQAKYIYHIIKGGLFEFGRFAEYYDGIYPQWNYENPISLVGHSFGCNVIIELCELLSKNNMEPNKMINKIVFISPLFLHNKNLYNKYLIYIYNTFFKYIKFTTTYPFFKNIYNTYENIFISNKIPIKTNFYEQIILNKINDKYKNFFIDENQIQSQIQCHDTLSHININNIFKYKYNIPYKIYIGKINFTYEYFYKYNIISIFYLYLCFLLDLNKIDVFDGVVFYDKKKIQEHIEFVDNLGHFDFLFYLHPFVYFNTKYTFYTIFSYLRNKKVTNKIK